jgi:hypothetical protein
MHNADTRLRTRPKYQIHVDIQIHTNTLSIVKTIPNLSDNALSITKK